MFPNLEKNAGIVLKKKKYIYERGMGWKECSERFLTALAVLIKEYSRIEKSKSRILQHRRNVLIHRKSTLVDSSNFNF